MSEEKKGISLRTKRKARPPISAPKQISGPIQQKVDDGRSRDDSRSFDTPPQRAQKSGKVRINPAAFLETTNCNLRRLTWSNGDTLHDSIISQQTLMHLYHLCQICHRFPSSLLLPRVERETSLLCQEVQL